jgi:hypothetical protein
MRSWVDVLQLPKDSTSGLLGSRKGVIGMNTHLQLGVRVTVSKVISKGTNLTLEIDGDFGVDWDLNNDNDLPGGSKLDHAVMIQAQVRPILTIADGLRIGGVSCADGGDTTCINPITLTALIYWRVASAEEFDINIALVARISIMDILRSVAIKVGTKSNPKEGGDPIPIYFPLGKIFDLVKIDIIFNGDFQVW